MSGDGVCRITSDASFGNVRYGKSFSAEPTVEFIMKHYKGRIERVLDVGAGDLSFVRTLLGWDYHPYVAAVEPDKVLIERWGELPNGVQAFPTSIESFSCEGAYDLIHCSHTLEHIKDPLKVLRQLRKMLARNGILYVEVPNLATIRHEDIVEEWFLDKHLYHFNAVSLRTTLAMRLRYQAFMLVRSVGERTYDL